MELSGRRLAVITTSIRPPSTEPRSALWFIDNLARVCLDGRETGGTCDVVEVECRRGDMPPLHVHSDHDETFCLLEGQATLYLPGRAVELEAGETFFAPRGVPHTYRAESERVRWLVLGTPAGFGDFVREVSDEPDCDGFPPPDREHDPARLAEAAARHGIELLGPPGALPS
jgi:quercetin dioxygenase-like cupin family protein